MPTFFIVVSIHVKYNFNAFYDKKIGIDLDIQYKK